MSTETISQKDEILKNNLDYTLFSWSKQKGISPLAIKRAEGVYLYDYDDKKYIDFSSGLMNVNIGHGNQRVTKAVTDQMQQVSYVTPSCVTEVRGELGKNLQKLLRVILLNLCLLFVELRLLKMQLNLRDCIQANTKSSPVTVLFMELLMER